MAKWTIIAEGNQIYKDGVSYTGLDTSWLPEGIRAVQSSNGTEAFIEYDNQQVGAAVSEQVYVADITQESWWSNVSTEWNTANDAYEADLAAQIAAVEARQGGGD